jgi:hypothetical protein
VEMVNVLNELIPLAVSSRNREIRLEDGNQSFSALGLDSLDRLVMLTFVLDVYQIETDVQESPMFDTALELQDFVYARSPVRFPDKESLEIAVKNYVKK